MYRGHGNRNVRSKLPYNVTASRHLRRLRHEGCLDACGYPVVWCCRGPVACSEVGFLFCICPPTVWKERVVLNRVEQDIMVNISDKNVSRKRGKAWTENSTRALDLSLFLLRKYCRLPLTEPPVLATERTTGR